MIIAANVGQNMGVVMPSTGNVTDGTIYGWPDTRTGTFSCDPTDPPVITNVVDNLDADSVTVSVEGSGTIQLYYRQSGTSPWTTGNTRTGDGDIDQGGLTPATWYEMYATAADPNESGPSNLVMIYLAGEEGAGTLKSAIYAILMGDTDVQALVDGRVGPGGDPVEGKTSVVFHVISSIRGHTQSGPDDLAMPTLQVNSYGFRDYTAEQVSDAVRKALDGFNGTVNGVFISYMALEDEGDLDDFEPGNRRVSRHGVRQDYLVTYTEN